MRTQCPHLFSLGYLNFNDQILIRGEDVTPVRCIKKKKAEIEIRTQEALVYFP